MKSFELLERIMKIRGVVSAARSIVSLMLLVGCMAGISFAQQPNTGVPTLVNFSGRLTDVNSKAVTGTVGVTFYLYSEQQGGSPLWIETQNVQPDKSGHYSVMLGSTSSQGLPTNLFASGEARWLGVQAEGQAEQPRVMLLAVPYALKAGDAATIGGLPPSAFVLAAPATAPGNPASAEPPGISASTTVGGSGTTDFIPLWSSSMVLGNSVLFQSGSGSSALLGINTTTPASTLDVNGGVTSRGNLQLPSLGTASASQGYNSQPFQLQGSAYNSGTGKTIGPLFQWQTEPSGNNTSNPSGTLNLLYGNGSGSPTETGLKLSNGGVFTFASGQTFPGTGTITGVTAGGGLSGGGTSGNVTLAVPSAGISNAMLQNSSLAVNPGTALTGGGAVSLGGSTTLSIDTTKIPQLGAANTFTNNQTINGSLTANGAINGQTGNFSGNNTTQVLNVTQAGTGSAIVGSVPSSASTVPAAVLGNLTGASGVGFGVEGVSSSVIGMGVYGLSPYIGVAGATSGSSGQAVYGYADASGSGNTADGVLGVTYAPNGIGVDGTNEGTSTGIGVRGYTYNPQGIGVYGFWDGPSSAGTGYSEIGVWGDSSSGIAVNGTSDSNLAVNGYSSNYPAISGSSGTYEGVFGGGVTGVFGYTNSTVGTYGEFFSRSNSGAGWANVGTWGDTGCFRCVGVLGTVDDGNALFGVNNSAGNNETLYVANNSGFNGGTPVVARFAGPGSSTYCSIQRDTNDNGTGDLVCTGSKSAAVPVAGNRMVRLYAVEAADNWFEDAGSGQLSNGAASIPLDATFAQTVNGDMDYHVFLTPNGDCDGLYVTHKTARGFEVHELHGGRSSVTFDYRIMARRKGFEKVRMQDVTADFAQMKRESETLAAKLEANKAKEKVHPSMIIPTLPKKSSWHVPLPSKPPVPAQPIARMVERKK
jgi:hypothetical protein